MTRNFAGKSLIFGQALCWMLASLLAVGCVGPFGDGRGKKAVRLPEVLRIAVLPMDRASVRPGQERATCALSDTAFEAYEVSPEAGDAVTQVLFRLVEGDSRFRTVPEGQCIGFLSSLINADVKASQLRLIQAFGKELHSDAVLYGKLFRYVERVGSPYSVEKPASVAFTLHLIRAKDGAILWRFTFDETQQPLSENILKANLYRRSGMRWLTAEELSDYGLTQAMEELRSRLP